MPLYHACPVGAENRDQRSVQGSLQAPADALAGFRRLKGIQDEGFGSCDRFNTSRWLSAPLLIEGETNSRSEPPLAPSRGAGSCRRVEKKVWTQRKPLLSSMQVPRREAGSASWAKSCCRKESKASSSILAFSGGRPANRNRWAQRGTFGMQLSSSSGTKSC
ncbi:uncharacterized protein UHOD_11757 [Ustilago sp. UG-2017b]|nr:uncharacterized protein UHOD_11757 [Ustilago sp. UG-2017b]